MFLEKLESSTIHGLAHISTSRRKLVRIFWIIVVITAMGIAGINILFYLLMAQLLDTRFSYLI